MSNILDMDGKPVPQLAPDSIYYELHTELTATYQRWAQRTLQGQPYVVQLEKIRFKIAEACNGMLEALDKDFTPIEGDQNNDDDKPAGEEGKN